MVSPERRLVSSLVNSLRVVLPSMGNHVSCTDLSSTQTASNSLRSAVKVIFPAGEVRRLLTATKAAELMLETPNHFLVNYQSLQVGWRISALNADDDLDMGNVYVMFPMQRLNSKITASDLGRLSHAGSSSKRAPSCDGSGPGGVRVLPESDGVPSDGTDWSSEAPKFSLEGIGDLSTPDFRHRMSMSRSKKPLLETITEEQVKRVPKRVDCNCLISFLSLNNV